MSLSPLRVDPLGLDEREPRLGWRLDDPRPGARQAARQRVWRRGGDDVLAPGWTDYSVRIPVTTYDVTGLVRPGANAIAVTLADGWYAGTLGWEGRRCHYRAYGAIGEWLHAGAAGIECAAPGYRRIRFRPRPGGDLAWARAEIRPPHGPVRCGWRVEDGELPVDAAVPPNASAILELPGRRPEALRPGIHSRRVPWQAAGA